MLEKVTKVKEIAIVIDTCLAMLKEELEIREDGELLAVAETNYRLIDPSADYAVSWAKDDHYPVGALVIHQDARWLATAPTSDEPSVGSVSWRKVPEKSATHKIVEATRRAIAEATKDTLTRISVEDVERLRAIYPQWEEGMAISYGDVIVFEGAFYRANKEHTALTFLSPSFDTTLWTRFSSARDAVKTPSPGSPVPN